MKSIRPYIRYFSSAKMLIDMPNKETCVAMSWSGDYIVASTRAAQAGIDINLAYAMPEKGIPAWVDSMFIPSDAPHPDNAYLLVNYLMRPEVIAPVSDFTGYANANRSATSLVHPDITGEPGHLSRCRRAPPPGTQPGLFAQEGKTAFPDLDPHQIRALKLFDRHAVTTS